MVGGGSDSGDDSDYDRAVEDVISQAMDHCVLEQLSALNNLHSDSDLPPDLNARFRKLKTFPQSKPKSTTPPPVTHPVPPPQQAEAAIPASAAAEVADTSKNNKAFSSPGGGESEPGSRIRRRGSEYSWSISSSSPRTPSPPPPPRSGCFCFSNLPSTMMMKKKKKRVMRKDEDDDGIRKIMEMARREEEKITREAERIVKLAKQASARIMIDVSPPPSTLHGISLSDSDDE